MVRALDWKAVKKTTLIEVMLRFFSMLGYVATVVLLFYYLLTGRVRVGAFAAIVASLDGMYDKLESMFRFRIGGITSQLGMAENYLTFLEMPEREGELAFPEGRTVEFRKVSFTYPNAAGKALSCVDLTIREKETIAIVGKNGAGKSTFARLLLGIYRPTQGQVLIDGVDTRRVRHDADAKCSAVFQRFQKYKMTVADNVLLGSSRDEPDESKIGAALEKADLPLAQRTFPEGTKTLLAREFGGTDLSGGQWQRLAFARALLADSPMMIFDEATSGVDVESENAIMAQIEELAKTKAVLVIAHRLMNVVHADCIHVMASGNVVESGTHEQLMARGGTYAKLFETQKALEDEAKGAGE